MNYVLFLGILLILALASNRVMKLLKLPAVTGYLIIGLIFAGICLIIDNYKGSNELLTSLNKLNNLVSSIALGFIALSIGEEFKLVKIKKYGKSIITITILQALSATFLVDIFVVIVCLLLKVNISVAIILGAIATATAPAATIMVINQYKAKGPLVDLLLPVVAFDDAIGLIVFSISVAISKVIAINAPLSINSILLLPLIDIFGSLLIGFLLGLLMHYIMPYFKSRNNHEVVFIAFTLVGVGLCVMLNNNLILFNEHLEFSNLLTCMMIGATYTNITKKDDEDIMYRDFELVDRWTPFLFMLFFVLSGTHLVASAKEILASNNISLLPVLIIFITYLIFRSLGKYLGAYIGCSISKYPKNIKSHLGITLLPQAGVAIGMANSISVNSAFKANNIGNIIVTVVLCATLIYELVGPLLTKFSLKAVGEMPDENGNYPYLNN